MNISYWLKHNAIFGGLLMVGLATFLFVKIATTSTEGYPIAWAVVGFALYIAGFLLAYWATRHD